MKEKILKAFEESIKVKEQFIKENIDAVIEVSKAIADTFNDGKNLFSLATAAVQQTLLI